MGALATTGGTGWSSRATGISSPARSEFRAVEKRPGAWRRAEISATLTGRPEAVALHGVHAGGTQERLLVGCFDTFGSNLHSEATAEADDRVHDGGGVRSLLDRPHEAAVNLELVEGKAPQIKLA